MRADRTFRSGSAFIEDMASKDYVFYARHTPRRGRTGTRHRINEPSMVGVCTSRIQMTKARHHGKSQRRSKTCVKLQRLAVAVAIAQRLDPSAHNHCSHVYMAYSANRIQFCRVLSSNFHRQFVRIEITTYWTGKHKFPTSRPGLFFNRPKVCL